VFTEVDFWNSAEVGNFSDLVFTAAEFRKKYRDYCTIEIWRHAHLDMETWKCRDIDMETRTWPHGNMDMET
jgi:hypothetical protein